MLMVRQPILRLLPVVMAAVVTLAVVGSLVHLVCEDEDSSGQPSEASAAVGLGLCVLSVAFLAGEARRAARALLLVLAVPMERPLTLAVACSWQFYGLPPPFPPTLPLLQVWRT